MSPTHRRYVLRETGVSVVINTAISIAFAVWVASDKTAVPLWGTGGMAVDFLPQTFMVSLATVIATTMITRKRLRGGRVPPLPLPAAGPLARMPQHVLLRALLIGLFAALVLSLLATEALQVMQVTSLSPTAFVTMKALYGAGVTVMISPPIVRAALAPPDNAIYPADRAGSAR